MTTSRLRERIVIVCYEVCHNFAIGPATCSPLDHSRALVFASGEVINASLAFVCYYENIVLVTFLRAPSAETPSADCEPNAVRTDSPYSHQ